MMICKARSVTQVQNSVGEIIIIESSKHKNIGDHSEVTSRLSIHVRIHWGELLKQYKDVALKFKFSVLTSHGWSRCMCSRCHHTSARGSNSSENGNNHHQRKESEEVIK